jgi:hypothetical protein
VIKRKFEVYFIDDSTTESASYIRLHTFVFDKSLGTTGFDITRMVLTLAHGMAHSLQINIIKM